MTNVLSIITDYLSAHGYDGLCSEGCGCGMEDLAPCTNIQNCQPAYRCPVCEGYYPTRNHADHEEEER